MVCKAFYISNNTFGKLFKVGLVLIMTQASNSRRIHSITSKKALSGIQIKELTVNLIQIQAIYLYLYTTS